LTGEELTDEGPAGNWLAKGVLGRIGRSDDDPAAVSEYKGRNSKAVGRSSESKGERVLID
jgi:hypothetical protein